MPNTQLANKRIAITVRGEMLNSKFFDLKFILITLLS